MNPISEVALAQPPGSTGYQPVPSGYQPLGTTTACALVRGLKWRRGRLAIPSGQWPDGNRPVACAPHADLGVLD